MIYLRIVKWSLLVLKADLSACCQLLANCWKINVFDQIQCYFSVNKLTTDFQHAYREGHSTCTALTQMSDEKIVGAVLLDFSAAFDIIDHVFEKKLCVMAFQPLPCHGFRAINQIQHGVFSLMEASLMLNM